MLVLGCLINGFCFFLEIMLFIEIYVLKFDCDFFKGYVVFLLEIFCDVIFWFLRILGWTCLFVILVYVGGDWLIWVINGVLYVDYILVI